MKSRIILILALFLTLTSFRSDGKAVKLSDSNIVNRLYADYQIPSFTRKLRDLVVREGENAMFEVIFVGIPECEVTWYKDGVEIKSGGRFRIDTKNGVSTLIIKDVRMEDQGEYTVRIKNVAGEAYSTAKLKVIQYFK
ncbi:immunoglobulin domain-containing protein [Gabonibacter chumensis]|uniref:immunoglobulin domain-containing protein n=1 Tax=Gabonibacter chumensis TaxID=2972474 RepID=UPI00257262AF|nr:immunoglobulin domain-containing protein [Gabonibacter chumensis]MCR9011051.1 immunoglobulin domain-containing protein [Gabonibacter chumensis]